ncbi:sulfite exporter TauE/SafE family protein [Neobittarella massiliensis]|uniref:sulfite exporter TauE/SafE family protein n=1 Tax=Neobittarella massiliensis (ex Bilen et al. 2018) TaxID=2041842 RepID=UPI000CF659B5|nr:sulfite exporter TauE/SafE family protein [Neobittarella massiliensis]
MSWVIAVVASVIAGFVSALGLGGGGILILYLTLFLDMGQKQAGGINLIFFLPIAAVSIFIHVKNKMIDYKFALKCAPFGIAGAFLGVWIAGMLSPRWVGKAFAVLVLILGIKELFSKTPPKEKDTE